MNWTWADEGDIKASGESQRWAGEIRLGTIARGWRRLQAKASDAASARCMVNVRLEERAGEEAESEANDRRVVERGGSGVLVFVHAQRVVSQKAKSLGSI